MKYSILIGLLVYIEKAMTLAGLPHHCIAVYKIPHRILGVCEEGATKLEDF